jgi:hypothetical protein
MEDLTPEERAAQRQQTRDEQLKEAELASVSREYYWNEEAARYIDGQGRFVSEKVVRAAVDEALLAASQSAVADFEAMRKGEITVGEWERRMRRHIKNAHLTNARLASGGLSGGARRRVEDVLREGTTPDDTGDFHRLHRFAQQVADEEIPLDGRARQRARGYVQKGRSTYHAEQRVAKQKNGYNQERNVLGIAEHCDECVEITGKGWSPTGSLVLIGNRTCLYNCKCRIEYRSTESSDAEPFPSIKGTPQQKSPYL